MAVEKESAQFSTLNFSTLLIITALVLWITKWYYSRRHLLKLAKKIPGPDGLPLIGNALELRGSTTEIFKAISKYSSQHESLFKIWIGPKLIVFLTNPHDIEIILSSQVHLDKASEYNLFRPWLGNGLLTSTGDTWRAHRKLIAPTFHMNVLRNFVELFNKNSRLTVEKLKKFTGKTFDCHEYMCEATVEILLETVMGVPNLTKKDEAMNYAVSVIKLNDLLHLRQFKPWFKVDLFYKLVGFAKEQLHLLNNVHRLRNKVLDRKKYEFHNNKNDVSSILNEEVETHKETKLNGNGVTLASINEHDLKFKDDLDIQDNSMGEKKRKPFLDSLMDYLYNSSDISEQEVKDQVDTIMFEGHDTTASGSSFFLSLMGIHQNVQAKVMEELYQIFGDSDRPATFADTLEMKYLERCILETLRMYPPVPMIARQVKKDLKLVSGDYTIPAGTTVTIGTYWLHHNPSLYADPNTFNPDNFLPDKMTNRHYYSFIPFSAGPRSCVGRKYAILKLKIFLSTLLRNYHVYSDMTESDFQLTADIILKRSEGTHIRLEPRKRFSKVH